MTSPAQSPASSSISQSSDANINALLAGVKWGGQLGTGTTLSFSFPWAASSTAVFDGFGGSPNYSAVGEPTASVHKALSVVQQEAVHGALAAWASVANLTFNGVADTQTDVGDLRFAWTSAQHNTSSGQPAWGWAYFPSASPSAGDVWISTLSSGTNWSAGQYNYEALLHEIGHTLGLKHDFEDGLTLPPNLDSDDYTVMSYTRAPHSIFYTAQTVGGSGYSTTQVSPETPMVLDIAAIQYLYGANMSYHTGDDVYTFDPAKPFFKTIWDAGGNDTVSISNFTNGSTIDLRPGHYSSIAIASAWPLGAATPADVYDGTSNLGIAYGVTIENAIGGSGNDTIWGNAADNHLDGGAGNDVMYGDAGNDVFDANPAQRAGNDTFQGGTGNDTYYVTAGDKVVESPGEGNDTIFTQSDYSLEQAANVENLCVAPGVTANLRLTGNAQDNTFAGCASNDTFIGGAGQDTVVYDTASSNFTFTATNSGHAITSSTSGNDLLTGIELVKFSDKTVHLIDLTSVAFASQVPGPTGVRADLVLTFTSDIARGTGTLILDTANGVTVESIDAATSSDISISGSMLTLHTKGQLAYGTSYVLTFSDGALRDTSGNPAAGTETYYTAMLPGGKTFTGTAISEYFVGTALPDTFSGGGGYDTLDGNAGQDTAIYLGARAGYAVSKSNAGWMVQANQTNEATDTLLNIERLHFSDLNVALDIGGSAGVVARFLGAVFGSQALSNPSFAGIGLNLLDQGMGTEQLMQLALDNSAIGPQASDKAVVDLLYSNIAGQAPNSSTEATFVNMLQSHVYTQVSLALMAADSAENEAAINLTGLAATGLNYLPIA